MLRIKEFLDYGKVNDHRPDLLLDGWILIDVLLDENVLLPEQGADDLVPT